MDGAAIFIILRLFEIHRLETNSAQQLVNHKGPHTPTSSLASNRDNFTPRCRLLVV